MKLPEILYQGELEAHPVPRLLNFLYRQEQTGRLVLVQEGVNKTIYLIQGVPASVESSLRDETLGRYLIKQGRITEEEYERSLELMRQENCQQGAALVKLGILKPRELYQLMKAQTLNKILTAFSFQEGQYRFYAETEFVGKITRFEFNFFELLKKGIELYLPESTLERELKKISPEELMPLPGFPKRLTIFQLSEAEQEFVRLIDGTKTLIDLINLEPAYPFARKLLYLLLLTGLVGPSATPAIAIQSLVPEEERESPVEKEITISSSAPEAVDVQEIETLSPQTPEMIPESEKAEAETGLTELEEDKESPERIGEFYIEMKGKNYLELLQVSDSTTDEEVESAYRNLLKEFERTRFPARMESEMEQKLEEINTEIIKAYETLRTKERRERYWKQIYVEREEKRVSRELEAEKYLQEGIRYVRARDWANAQKMFEKAIELKPEEPEYYGYLGWSIYSNPEIDLEQRRELAKEKIKQAIKMNPNMDSAHVFLAKIFKDEGKTLQAVYEFREALRCNPNCREARRELEAQGIKI